MKWSILIPIGVIALSIILIGLPILSPSIPKAFASGTVIVVPDDYPTIDGAISASTSGDTILVKAGLYSVTDFVLVNKSLTITGENLEDTIVDGGTTARVLFQVIASNVDIENLTLQNTDTSPGTLGPGIRINNASNTILRNVKIHNVYDGVQMQSASFSVISNCSLDSCADGGIFVRSNSNNNTIFNDDIRENGFGIYFADTTCQNNSIYHNNMINNTHQFSLFGGVNFLDEGYPQGGNYWSDYSDVDIYDGPGQNFTGSDGIFDHPYPASPAAADNYPLTNPLTFANVTAEGQVFAVDVATNSTILSVDFSGVARTLSVQVTGNVGQISAARVTIPKILLSSDILADWIITFKGNMNASENPSRFIIDDANNTFIFVTYSFSQNDGMLVFTGTNAVPEYVDAVAMFLSICAVSVGLLCFSRRLRSMKNAQRLTHSC